MSIPSGADLEFLPVHLQRSSDGLRVDVEEFGEEVNPPAFRQVGERLCDTCKGDRVEGVAGVLPGGRQELVGGTLSGVSEHESGLF